MSFFDRSPFVGGGGRLANAFFVEDVDYGWGRGHSEAVA
jgi:hypothetical protein